MPGSRGAIRQQHGDVRHGVARDIEARLCHALVARNHAQCVAAHLRLDRQIAVVDADVVRLVGAQARDDGAAFAVGAGPGLVLAVDLYVRGAGHGHQRERIVRLARGEGQPARDADSAAGAHAQRGLALGARRLGRQHAVAAAPINTGIAARVLAVGGAQPVAPARAARRLLHQLGHGRVPARVLPLQRERCMAALAQCEGQADAQRSRGALAVLAGAGHVGAKPGVAANADRPAGGSHAYALAGVVVQLRVAGADRAVAAQRAACEHLGLCVRMHRAVVPGDLREAAARHLPARREVPFVAGARVGGAPEPAGAAIAVTACCTAQRERAHRAPHPGHAGVRGLAARAGFAARLDGDAVVHAIAPGAGHEGRTVVEAAFAVAQARPAGFERVGRRCSNSMGIKADPKPSAMTVCYAGQRPAAVGTKVLMQDRNFIR